MGAEAAVNAVFFNQIQAIDDPDERERFVAAKREEYAADIDILHLASELVVDAVIEPDDLRAELIRRFALAEAKDRALLRTAQPDHPGLSGLRAQVSGQADDRRGPDDDDQRPQDGRREPAAVARRRTRRPRSSRPRSGLRPPSRRRRRRRRSPRR